MCYDKDMKPTENEPICLISYEVTKIRLGGEPDSRPSFWKVYREEQQLNQKTQFQNEHVRICRPMLLHLKDHLGKPAYFRRDRLLMERSLVKENSIHEKGLAPIGR